MASPEPLPNAPIAEAILDVRVSARRDLRAQDFLALTDLLGLGPRRVFSVSVRRDGNLHYAGLFGPNKSHGSEVLLRGIPDPIAQGIRRALSSVSESEAGVADTELSTRLLTQSNQKSTTAVRKRAFGPMFDLQRQRFETSMYRISGLSGDEIKQIAQTKITDKNGTVVIGRGDIFVALIHKQPTLRPVVDEPSARHAVIKQTNVAAV